MKFAALIATAAAVKIEGGQPTCGQIAKHVFNTCDGNGNGSITWGEARKCGAPKEWKGEFLRVAGDDKAVDRGEFMTECRRHLGDAQVTEQPSCQAIAGHIWDLCDHNDDGDITWKEARKCGASPDDKPIFDHIAGDDGRADQSEFISACEAHFNGDAQEQGGPSCKQIWGHIRKQCDASGDKHISWGEARKCGLPKDAKELFHHVAGEDGLVDRGEFLEACRQMQ